ncbi:MAG TPA: hypothetical protein VFZ48_02010 [Candidatus Saccharimonadales bacterium]
MKDKKIFKKWWFWVAVIIVLGGIGSLGRTDDNKTPNTSSSPKTERTSQTDKSALPILKVNDYKNKEGLIAYKDLQSKGYEVEAVFEKQIFTDMNGKASDMFEPLNPKKPEDRLSVDAFKVGSLVQDADNVKLTIIHSVN